MTDEERKEDFFEWLKKGAIILGIVTPLTVAGYYGFIQAPINGINDRIEKIEIKLQGMGDLKQSVAVIEERSKNMSQDLKEIKEELRKHN